MAPQMLFIGSKNPPPKHAIAYSPRILQICSATDSAALVFLHITRTVLYPAIVPITSVSPAASIADPMPGAVLASVLMTTWFSTLSTPKTKSTTMRCRYRSSESAYRPSESFSKPMSAISRLTVACVQLKPICRSFCTKSRCVRIASSRTICLIASCRPFRSFAIKLSFYATNR